MVLTIEYNTKAEKQERIPPMKLKEIEKDKRNHDLNTFSWELFEWPTE